VDYTDWTYVEKHEQPPPPPYSNHGFYPDDKKHPNTSDLDIAAGVNLTKHSASDIESWKQYTVDHNTLDQLKPYAGLTYSQLPANHVNFTEDQRGNIQVAAEKANDATLSREWNTYQSEHNSKEYQVGWLDLSHGVKAAMADIHWNTGNTRGDQPGDFWHEAFQQHWSAAATALINDSANYKEGSGNATRRLDDSAQIIEDLSYGDAPNYGG
jgi:hypothetical protein